MPQATSLPTQPNTTGTTGIDPTRLRIGMMYGMNHSDAFARLAVELHDAGGVVETVEAVAQFALQALNCSYAGITLYTRGARPKIAAVTDPVVAEAYEMQLDSEIGPLVTSLRNRTTVLIPDTAIEQRWPEWAARRWGS